MSELLEMMRKGRRRLRQAQVQVLRRLGRRQGNWSGCELETVATDPLAAAYNELFIRLSMRPLVPLIHAEAEKVPEQFGNDSFDLTYASNSLDHSYDPLASIGHMLAVVKPGRYVYLWHFANVGVHECYTGLHQWNFDLRQNEFVVSNGRETRSVGEALGKRAAVSGELQEAFSTKVVVARIRKLGDS